MPVRTVFNASIEHYSILDENGVLDERLAEDTLTDEQVLFLYERMTFVRAYDEVAFKLQRSGRMGTYPQNKGQEAIGAVGLLARKQDWIVPCYRENTALFIHGLPPEMILLHWMGDERGNQIPEGLNQLPISVPIGTHMLHAAGIGWAMRLQKKDSVVFTVFGDGATSEGDFHEAMNFAATQRAPVVFICQNNGWAISVPTTKQTRSETFAQKGLAYGARCVQVDGNDVFAIYKAAKEAREHAKRGEITLIETLTYRLGDHTTADDARRYRDAVELESWQRKDPLVRVRKHLERKDLWDQRKQEDLDARVEKEVREVVDRAVHIEEPTSDDIFNYVFESLPPELQRQRETRRTSALGQNPGQESLHQQETERV